MEMVLSLTTLSRMTPPSNKMTMLNNSLKIWVVLLALQINNTTLKVTTIQVSFHRIVVEVMAMVVDIDRRLISSHIRAYSMGRIQGIVFWI